MGSKDYRHHPANRLYPYQRQTEDGPYRLSRHEHDFRWLGWLKNAALRQNTEASWCRKCGAIKTRIWHKGGIPEEKIRMRKP